MELLPLFLFIALVVTVEVLRRLWDENGALWTVIGELLERVQKLENQGSGNPSAVRLEFYEIIDGKEVKVESMKTVQGVQEISYKVKSVKDDFGNEAPLDGAPVWSLSNPELGSLEVAADGMSAKAMTNGKAGKLDVIADGDAKIGEGEVRIVGKAEIEVLPSEARVIELEEV